MTHTHVIFTGYTLFGYNILDNFFLFSSKLTMLHAIIIKMLFGQNFLFTSKNWLSMNGEFPNSIEHLPQIKKMIAEHKPLQNSA